MSTILTNLRGIDQRPMSVAYTETMLSLMEQNSKIVEFEADLGRSLLGGDGYHLMKEKYPLQFVECGIQEANMLGVAAGMSLVGWIPFIHTFAAFASRRIADQTFVSGCYERANIRIIGSDPGIMAAYNGGTHMALEDISIYQAFPNMTILDPADSTALESLLPVVANNYGMFYLRISRKNTIKVYESGTTFTLGKGKVLTDGDDVTIIAEGIEVSEALAAAELLRTEGIQASVIDMFTIKPIDQELILKMAAKTGAIVTAENHSTINGLGAAVAEVIVKNRPVPMEMIGIENEFGQVGSVDFLKERYAVNALAIADKAKKVIARKMT